MQVLSIIGTCNPVLWEVVRLCVGMGEGRYLHLVFCEVFLLFHVGTNHTLKVIWNEFKDDVLDELIRICFGVVEIL